MQNVMSNLGRTNCPQEAPTIHNAQVLEGSGISAGATRSFRCSGNFSWDDGTSTDKVATCRANGEWSKISTRCKRLLTLAFLPSCALQQ